MTTRIIHVKELAAFPDAVYIGRAMPRQRLKASPFANPYKIGPGVDRSYVITLYEQHFVTHPELWRLLPTLRGKPLACWCRYSHEEKTLENTCHGDLLAGLLAYCTDEKLIEIAQAKGCTS